MFDSCQSYLEMAKSISKKTSPSSPEISSSPPTYSRGDRNRDIALYHANLLQQRKDAESLILSSTEILVDFPSFQTLDPSRPYLGDANYAKNLLKPFQPLDYDSIIEERNINKKCGYILCPRPNKQENTMAKYRILQHHTRGAHNLKIVERHMLERWCSDECGKRALHIKVQLNDEPVWMRASDWSGRIAFLDEGIDTAGLIEQTQNLSVGDGFEEERLASAMKELAIKRGDVKSPGKLSGLVGIDIRENVHVGASSERGLNFSDSHAIHGALEGYVPKFGDWKGVGQEQEQKDWEG